MLYSSRNATQSPDLLLLERLRKTRLRNSGTVGLNVIAFADLRIFHNGAKMDADNHTAAVSHVNHEADKNTGNGGIQRMIRGQS